MKLLLLLLSATALSGKTSIGFLSCPPIYRTIALIGMSRRTKLALSSLRGDLRLRPAHVHLMAIKMLTLLLFLVVCADGFQSIPAITQLHCVPSIARAGRPTYPRTASSGRLLPSMRAKGKIQSMNPHSLRFTQDSITAHFQDGALLRDVSGAVETNFQALADKFAARTPKEKKADGRNTKKVGKAVKKALGDTAQVKRAGSAKKKVDIAGSDLDLLVDTSHEPVTNDQRNRLWHCLKERFPDAEFMNLHYTSIRIVPAKGRSMDVVLRHVPGNIKPMPRNHFKNDDNARMAIRIFKKHMVDQGKKAKGVAVERHVIEFRKDNRGCTGEQIYEDLMRNKNTLLK